MTKVFVNGNPETPAIWGPLIAALHDRGIDDTVALAPPGFGAAVPVGFEATPAGYVDWLTVELESIDGPVDLVGHDWGAGHVLGLAASRPDLIRSWAVDIIGIVHPDYVWHDAAQIWRTPDAGEEMVAGLVALPTEEKVAMFVGLGMPETIAAEVAPWTNEDMAASILTLYRGADPEVLQDVAARLEAADRRPGLALSATADPYVSADLAPATAERFGAGLATLEDRGHWWMFDGADEAADVLADFWRRLD